jgi:hypothetical protein
MERRVSKLEETFSGERCVFCQQYYWVSVATNKAIGPYSETEYGNEAGLTIARELEALLPKQGGGLHRADDILPRYDLDVEHEGIIEAYRRVEESRLPRESCPCFEAWLQIRSIEARVLRYYPRVAKQLIEDLNEYAASPLKRQLFHFIGECACR